jgi:hypothetical protein
MPQEYVLKAVTAAFLGQKTGAPDYLKQAQQMFHLVGSSATECDTIPGRQCMSSYHYLLKQFEDVNVYLGSIKPYLFSDDDFCWNYGLSLAAVGNYKEAEETLLLVQNTAHTTSPVYLSWLARCYIMNRKARQVRPLGRGGREEGCSGSAAVSRTAVMVVVLCPHRAPLALVHVPRSQRRCGCYPPPPPCRRGTCT